MILFQVLSILDTHWVVKVGQTGQKKLRLSVILTVKCPVTEQMSGVQA